MSLRACLRLLLLAAMLVAPLGRIGMAQAAGHCGGGPAASAMQHEGKQHRGATNQEEERLGVDCLIACAAMAPAPAATVAPPRPAPASAPVAIILAEPGGLHPDAELPPPRLS